MKDFFKQVSLIEKKSIKNQKMIKFSNKKQQMKKICSQAKITFVVWIYVANNKSIDTIRAVLDNLLSQWIFLKYQKLIKFFLAPSSSVVTRMKNFLVDNKCCVSFPLCESPLIVLNGKFQDKRVIFSSEDDVKNGTCALSLVTDDSSLDVVNAIIDHLSLNFKDSWLLNVWII